MGRAWVGRDAREQKQHRNEPYPKVLGGMAESAPKSSMSRFTMYRDIVVTSLECTFVVPTVRLYCC